MGNVWVENKLKEERSVGSNALPFYAGLRIGVTPEENINFEETGFEVTVAKNRYFKPRVKTKAKLAKVKPKSSD